MKFIIKDFFSKINRGKGAAKECGQEKKASQAKMRLQLIGRAPSAFS